MKTLNDKRMEYNEEKKSCANNYWCTVALDYTYCILLQDFLVWFQRRLPSMHMACVSPFGFELTFVPSHTNIDEKGDTFFQSESIYCAKIKQFIRCKWIKIGRFINILLNCYRLIDLCIKQKRFSLFSPHRWLKAALSLHKIW